MKNNYGREYGKYEFCKALKCFELKPYLENAFRCARGDCIWSAAYFHRWLDKNGFAIVKKVTKNEG